MSHPSHHRFILVAGLLLTAASASAASAAPAPGTAPTKAAAQSRHIKETVDALFKHRLKPDPLPVSLPNPFLVVSGTMNPKHPDGTESESAAEADGEAPDGGPVIKPGDEVLPGSDAEALARYVAALKIGGVIQINGQLQLIINQFPRKEGDLIFLDNRNAVHFLKIIRLTPLELTLGLNEAVQTVRLKN